MNPLQKFYRMLTRKKRVLDDEKALLEGSGLKRALTLIDLTALGVGSTLGVGVYVLAGSVALETAGPAVVVSFLIAAIASTFAGLCYAEFAARVPKAGSAYVYSYVCVGEFIAFVIGWNLVLEYVVGSASVVRALSGYIDDLFNQTMAHAFENLWSIQPDFLSDYPDFFSFILALIFAGIVAFGVKESSAINNVFTTLNLAVVTYVIICGLWWVDFSNWTISVDEIPPEYQDTAGKGGFMPFGVAGVISGAASCFYGFVGFDCVATTGEEAKNPQRDIPIAIVISLFIIFLGYFGVSVVLTMMWPYYLQDPNAPLPHVFNEVGWYVAAWIITIGAIFGLCASLMGAFFPLPRILYAMSNDGIIYKFLGKVHPRFQTPVVGTLLAGLLTGILAAMFNLQQLVDMMSIGTLLAYSMVAACVMLLRFLPAGEREIFEARKIDERKITLWRQLFNKDKILWPSQLSSDISTWGTFIYVILSFSLGCVITFASSALGRAEAWAIILIIVVGCATILNVVIIGKQPVSRKALNFRVPWVPLIPAISIFVNLFLMLSLDKATWIRFGGWMAIGFIIYFGYGIWNSKEEIGSRRNSYIVAHEGIENKAFESDSGDSKKIKN